MFAFMCFQAFAYQNSLETESARQERVPVGGKAKKIPFVLFYNDQAKQRGGRLQFIPTLKTKRELCFYGEILSSKEREILVAVMAG